MEGVGTAAVSLPMFRQVTTLPVPSSLGFLDDHGLHGMRMLLKATPGVTHSLERNFYSAQLKLSEAG